MPEFLGGLVFLTIYIYEMLSALTIYPMIGY